MWCGSEQEDGGEVSVDGLEQGVSVPPGPLLVSLDPKVCEERVPLHVALKQKQTQGQGHV